MYLYIYLSTYLSIYLSIHPSIYLSIYICIYRLTLSMSYPQVLASDGVFDVLDDQVRPLKLFFR